MIVLVVVSYSSYTDRPSCISTITIHDTIDYDDDSSYHSYYTTSIYDIYSIYNIYYIVANDSHDTTMYVATTK